MKKQGTGKADWRLAFLALVASVCFAPVAHAVTYTTSGSSELFSLGDQMGSSSDYDQLAVTGVGPTTLSSGTITLDTLEFTAGVNAFVPASYDYSFDETMTLSNGGGTQTLTVPFTISISTADTISILGGTSLSFLVDGSIWDIVVNALTMGPNPGGSMFADLTATAVDPPPTPLPGTLALFASGLGAILLFGWRRNRQAPTITA